MNKLETILIEHIGKDYFNDAAQKVIDRGDVLEILLLIVKHSEYADKAFDKLSQILTIKELRIIAGFEMNIRVESNSSGKHIIKIADIMGRDCGSEIKKIFKLQTSIQHLTVETYKSLYQIANCAHLQEMILDYIEQEKFVDYINATRVPA